MVWKDRCSLKGHRVEKYYHNISKKSRELSKRAKTCSDVTQISTSGITISWSCSVVSPLVIAPLAAEEGDVLRVDKAGEPSSSDSSTINLALGE